MKISCRLAPILEARHEHLRCFLAPLLKSSMQAYKVENCAGFLTNATLYYLSEDDNLNSA